MAEAISGGDSQEIASPRSLLFAIVVIIQPCAPGRGLAMTCGIYMLPGPLQSGLFVILPNVNGAVSLQFVITVCSLKTQQNRNVIARPVEKCGMRLECNSNSRQVAEAISGCESQEIASPRSLLFPIVVIIQPCALGRGLAMTCGIYILHKRHSLNLLQTTKQHP
ncbi:hypothetical protein [Pinibacter soli]|uniref:Uncharacterized protein n=1 Tax=Pinibacter soli TaxID=3044211 RepID=A0ABT6RDD4_9BACT|nr:hypothetical protein [Pinibacter soli]MDI3320576.1 hypothetical protein [Pinibacter soli]